jgi:replication factor C subunit 2/4
MIANAEGVQSEDGVSSFMIVSWGLADVQVLPLILELAGGDLRKAITYLQTAQRLHTASDEPTPISALSGVSSPPSRYHI